MTSSFPKRGCDAEPRRSDLASANRPAARGAKCSLYDPHSLGEREASIEPTCQCRREGQRSARVEGRRCVCSLKQPEAAGSASSWQAVSWAVPGLDRCGNLSLTSREGRSTEPVGSASFSLVQLTSPCFLLRRFIFAKAWTLSPLSYPPGPWQVRKYCLRKENFNADSVAFPIPATFPASQREFSVPKDAEALADDLQSQMKCLLRPPDWQSLLSMKAWKSFPDQPQGLFLPFRRINKRNRKVVSPSPQLHSGCDIAVCSPSGGQGCREAPDGEGRTRML